MRSGRFVLGDGEGSWEVALDHCRALAQALLICMLTVRNMFKYIHKRKKILRFFKGWRRKGSYVCHGLPAPDAPESQWHPPPFWPRTLPNRGFVEQR